MRAAHAGHEEHVRQAPLAATRKSGISGMCLTRRMTRTALQIEADRHAEALRRSVALDMRRLREDAGATKAAVAALAGVDPSAVSRMEAGTLAPTLEMYCRLAAALNADLAVRVYPAGGMRLRDRHQARIEDLTLGQAHARWYPTLEAVVRRPVRGWIDMVLHDPVARLLVATELESGLRRLEQMIRWSEEKACALDSNPGWAAWSAGGGPPEISRLLIVRSTRENRAIAADARRILHAAYPADPRDALDALTGTAAWPGPAMLWARIDPVGSTPRLLP